MSRRSQTWKEYHTIIKSLKTRTYPSLKDLQHSLELRGMDLSTRTIERKFQEIRNDLSIEIAYDRDSKGYFVESESDINLDRFIHLFHLADKASFLIESMKEAKEVMSFVDFDVNEEVEGGYEYFPFLIEAMRNKLKVEFMYQSFNSDKAKPHNLYPYLLKEYLGRWYLIGYETHWRQIRTFGLERIQSLNTTNDKFETSERDKVIDRLRSIVGLIYSEGDECQVKVRYTVKEAKYQVSQPLHISQVVLEETEDYVLIAFFLAPNYEFKQRILMKGPEVEVLEPQWLREEMADWVQTLHSYYSN
jgi:predicted DNA-binding transcriptional regulator YafY